MIRKPAFSAISTGAVLAAFAVAATLPITTEASPPLTNKTATFQVSLTVQSDCSISASALPFGTATSTLATTALTHSTSLSVTCSTGTNYSIALDKGSVAASTVLARLLAGTGSNTQTVGYQLYSDSDATTVWGDATGGTPLTGVGTGSAVTIPVYGVVPAQSIPAADSYTSTETATITF